MEENEKVFRPMTAFITEQANGAVNAAKWIWDGIKSIFSSVAGFFKDIFGKAWAAVMEVFSAKGDIFTNIKDAILTSFKRIVNAIITGINYLAQGAVASVMGDQVSAMVAGFQALLAENQLLRQVVEGIELGDTTIGQSANRYNRRLAVMRGESI